MLLSSIKSDLSTALESDDSDHESQPAGPSVTRLSHFSRNYRRRVIDESSSDDEELAINRLMVPESTSTQRPAEVLEVKCY